jgi:ABC-type nitrate/sulfonate/bicarbonate transport system permease component
MATVTTTTALSPAQRRPERRPRAALLGAWPGDAVLGLLGVLVTIGGWQAASVLGILPASVVPSATGVAAGAAGLAVDAEFWVMLQLTLSSWAAGLALAFALAVPLGLLIGTSRFLDESTRAVIEFLKPIPPIALIPLGLLLWGPSTTMKLTLIVFGALWPLLTQVLYGVRDIDQMTVAMSRTYHLGWLRTLTHVRVPAVLPFVLTGLRVSSAIALIVTVVTEMLGGVPGLGRGIMDAQSTNALPRMYALIVVTGLVGLLVNGGFRLVERRLLRWHPSQRGRATR